MKESFKKIIGLDTETLEINKVQKFFSFQVFSPELKLNHFVQEKEALSGLFTFATQGSYFVCANAEFDISVINQILDHDRFTIETVYTPSKLIKAKIKDKHRHTWHIIDIFNIFPRYSVHKLGELLKIEKLERPEYLGKREPTKDEMEYFVKYAMRDSEIAYYSARMIIDEFGKLKPTLPSLSMSIFRKHDNQMQFWKQPEASTHLKIKNSLRGGRVESFCRGTIYDDIFAYDIRSLYPSMMYYGIFPDVNYEPEIKTSIDLEREGVALVTIQQDNNLPPLPIKHELKNIGLRLIFPNGIIKDWFTYPELRYLENFGYGKIKQVHEAIEYKKSFNPFQKWIKFLFDKRAEYLKQGSEKAELYKLMMNSLYGKFAQNLACGIYQLKNNEIIKVSETSGISKNTHFIIASYITAQGRLKLHRFMMTNKGDDILYCDTDGFLSTKNNYPVNDSLGNLTNRNFNQALNLTTLLRAKMYILNDKIVFKGLFQDKNYKLTGDQMRLKIMNNDMSFGHNILLKPRQALHMNKEPLTSYYKPIKFSLTSDMKRNYDKNLIGKTLITDFTFSKPLEIKVSA